jgi:hypothetical protein
MFYLLVLGLLGAVAAGGHQLTARLLRVRGLPCFSMKFQAEALASSRARRLMVRGAGPLAAYVLLVLLNVVLIASSGGEPTARVRVAPGHPAAQAGLRDGDLILAVRDATVRDFAELREHVQRNTGGSFPLRVERDGAVLTLEVMPDDQGRIGVAPSGERSAVPPSALLGAGGKPLVHFIQNLRFLWEYVTGGATEKLVVYQLSQGTGDERMPGGLWLALVLATTGSLVWPILLVHALIAAWRLERGRVSAAPQASLHGA